MTTLAFLFLKLPPFVLFEIDFSSALKLEYPLEYFDGTWQKCRTGPNHMSCTRMTTLPFLLLALSPFVIFDSDNPLILCPLCKSKTLWNIEYRTGPDDISRTRMTTLSFLLLVLSPFVMSDSDYPLNLCALCKSKILWNIFMILGRNVEQDQTTCCLQE